MEYWRQIPSFPMYSASNYGRIRNDKTGRILHMYPNPRGYLMLTLSKCGEQRSISVHRLIAETFLGGPHPDLDVNHIDGDKTNNCIENLEWCTRLENVRHAVSTGLRHGPKHEETRKAVRVIDDDLVFVSIRQCAEYLGCDTASLRYALTHSGRFKGVRVEFI